MWHTIDVYISYIVFKLEEAARVNFKSKQEIFNITKLNIITPQITQPTHRDRDRQTNKQDTDTQTQTNWGPKYVGPCQAGKVLKLNNGQLHSVVVRVITGDNFEKILNNIEKRKT